MYNVQYIKLSKNGGSEGGWGDVGDDNGRGGGGGDVGDDDGRGGIRAEVRKGVEEDSGKPTGKMLRSVDS